MKSKKKILLGIILSFIVLFTMTGCGKKALSSNEFMSEAIKYGLKVNPTISYANDDAEVTTATSKNDWEIEFYNCENYRASLRIFNAFEDKIDNAHNTGSSITHIDLFNYKKCTYTSSESYIVASKIGNTVVYVETNADNKKDVQEFLKTIDY